MTTMLRLTTIGCALTMLGFAGCGGGEVLPIDSGPTPEIDMGMPGMDAFVPPVDAWHPPGVDAAPDLDGGPPCMGTAPDCTSISDPTVCMAILGCGYGACAGTPPDCHHLATMATCTAVDGCAWDSICRGTARACGTYSDITSCGAQASCTWGTTSVCSGTSVPCTTLTSAQCSSQPGCGFVPTDAAVPEPDAWTPPPDAGCVMGTTSTMVSLHAVQPDMATGALIDLGAVHVHVESPCGVADRQLITDANGALLVSLPDGAAPWTVTLAKAGYAAVSIIDVTNIGFSGDVRLDPLVVGGPVTMADASGSVTGTFGAGSTVQVDCYDFDTLNADATHAFHSTFYRGYELPEPPIQFVALELSGGIAVNLGSTAPVTRTGTAITGVTIPMPSPALTASLAHVRVHLPTTGLTAPPEATALGAEHALTTPNNPFVLTGSTRVTRPTGVASDLDLQVTHFAGPLDVNLTGLTTANASAVLNVIVTDLSDHTITVPAVTSIDTMGGSLGSLSAAAVGAGYDALILQLGESDTERPHWRVIASAAGGSATITSLPRLPSAVSLADIGITGGAISFIPLYVHMQTGRAWTTQALNRAVPEYAWSVGTTYQTITTSGR